MTTAQQIIDALALHPHPEGGWFREVWREPAEDGGRERASSIHFLLAPGERSHWHRIDAAELWIYQAGHPLILRLAAEAPGGGAEIIEHRLGPDVLSGEQLQVLIRPGQWQAAQSGDGWGLVACVVAPAFEFSGFELAPRDWEPPAGPRS